jgi:hypothetical protein
MSQPILTWTATAARLRPASPTTGAPSHAGAVVEPTDPAAARPKDLVSEWVAGSSSWARAPGPERTTLLAQGPPASFGRFSKGKDVLTADPGSPVRFTLESNSVQDDTWLPEIGDLLKLAEHCHSIDIARTTGALREAARGRDQETASRRVALLRELPVAREAGRWGVSQWDGEAVWVGDDEVDLADPICRVLWNRPFAELFGGGRENRSRIEDVNHLATHARHGRDVFVTTDNVILGHAAGLMELGITVMDPTAAVEVARRRCEGEDR